MSTENNTEKQPREKLILTPEDGRNIVYGDNELFKTISDTMIDKSRWAIEYEIIVQRISDKKFFKSYYRRGSTESQDESPYEYDKTAKFNEVFPIGKTIIVYE